jgi:hypothetical protein
MFKKTIISIFILIISCQENKSERYVPKSNGKINHITVVTSEEIWNGEVGNLLKEKLSLPYEGLPIDEPIFSLKYLPITSFSGFAKSSRNVLLISKDSTIETRFLKNKYAKPQVVAFFADINEKNLMVKINNQCDSMIREFNKNEANEKRTRILKSLSKDIALFKKFNFDLKYPSIYKTVKDTFNFIWIEKKIPKGTLNIISYTLPYENFNKINLERVINIRDSIGRIYIPGRLAKTFMSTDRNYMPYFDKMSLSKLNALSIKGMWEVKNDFMGGPFINYLIDDFKNDRVIALEGFVFAPSISKRDYMFELKTILRTLKIY